MPAYYFHLVHCCYSVWINVYALIRLLFRLNMLTIAYRFLNPLTRLGTFVNF